MFPQGHVGLTTSLLKTFKLFGFLRIVTAIGDGVNEVIRQHEGDSLPVNPELLLVVAQEVAEVDVEELECNSIENPIDSIESNDFEVVKSSISMLNTR